MAYIDFLGEEKKWIKCHLEGLPHNKFVHLITYENTKELYKTAALHRGKSDIAELFQIQIKGK